MITIVVKEKQTNIVVDGDSLNLAMEMLAAIRAGYTALKNVDEKMADAFDNYLRNDLDDVLKAPIKEIEIHKMKRVQ